MESIFHSMRSFGSYCTPFLVVNLNQAQKVKEGHGCGGHEGEIQFSLLLSIYFW